MKLKMPQKQRSNAAKGTLDPNIILAWKVNDFFMSLNVNTYFIGRMNPYMRVTLGLYIFFSMLSYKHLV